MKDDEILIIIEKYLRKSIYPYAILIDGEWGCGKTYFVRNSLIPYIENNAKVKSKGNILGRKVLYISLYGVNSIGDISNQMYIQILPYAQNEIAIKASNLTSKIVSNIFKSVGITMDGIVEAMKTFVDFEKYVLIFDDLERCNLGVNEVLGFINNFVEHEDIKTIIIANQKEMGKISASDYLELKYLIDTNKNINVDTNGENHVTKEGNLNIEELKEKAEIIFNENYLYKQVKEKLIGITINYKADIGSIFESLVKEIILKSELHQTAIENKVFLIETASKLQHENLRTIQFALERFSEIGDIICEQKCGKYKEQILKEVFCYTVYSSIMFKKENYIQKWQGLNDVDFFEYDKGRKFGTIKGFRFIDVAISQSILDKEYIADFIKKYVSLNEEEYNPIENLVTYWELEDGEIIRQLNEIEIKLKTNNINFYFYSRLITKLIEIINMGFDIEYLNRSMKYIESNLNSSSSWINLERFGSLPTNKNILSVYKEKIKPLAKILEEKRIKRIEDDLNIFFEDGKKEDWGNEFYTYCWTNSTIFESNESFFSIMKIYKVIDCLKLSNSKNISDFRCAINEVNNYNDDYSNILNLSKELSEELVNFDGISKRYNIKLLIYSLNSKIELLKSEGKIGESIEN